MSQMLTSVFSVLLSEYGYNDSCFLTGKNTDLYREMYMKCEDENFRNECIERMVDKLVPLRTMLHLTQSDLAELLGIGRQTVVAIENKKRPMTWSIFLSLMFIFSQRPETKTLLDLFGIYTDELKDLYQNGDLREM